MKNSINMINKNICFIAYHNTLRKWNILYKEPDDSVVKEKKCNWTKDRIRLRINSNNSKICKIQYQNEIKGKFRKYLINQYVIFDFYH